MYHIQIIPFLDHPLKLQLGRHLVHIISVSGCFTYSEFTELKLTSSSHWIVKYLLNSKNDGIYLAKLLEVPHKARTPYGNIFLENWEH